MADASGEPPTYFANLVTSLLNADELTIEFRRVLVPHKSFLGRSTSAITEVPITPEDIAKAEPVARVVLTFSAARALQAYLDEVIPRFEAVRAASAKA